MWKTVLEVDKSWIFFSVSIAKEYVLLHVDDKDDWKEISIYRISAKAKANLEQIQQVIEQALENGELDIVANEVEGLTEQFIIGEMPKEYCNGIIVATPREDKRLNWELCVGDREELKNLLELLPEEWREHVKKLI